jgi:4-amino-4-deoxy-L-arabinose transferase-like glycosyltransferase
MLKTVLITGFVGMIIGFGGLLLTPFGDGSVRMEYLEFAVALLLFLVMLIGSSWFVMVEPGKDKQEATHVIWVDSRKFVFLDLSEVRSPHARGSWRPMLFDTTSDTTQGATR